jgi:hypothetical protein
VKKRRNSEGSVKLRRLIPTSPRKHMPRRGANLLSGSDDERAPQPDSLDGCEPSSVVGFLPVVYGRSPRITHTPTAASTTMGAHEDGSCSDGTNSALASAAPCESQDVLASLFPQSSAASQWLRRGRRESVHGTLTTSVDGTGERSEELAGASGVSGGTDDIGAGGTGGGGGGARRGKDRRSGGSGIEHWSTATTTQFATADSFEAPPPQYRRRRRGSVAPEMLFSSSRRMGSGMVVDHPAAEAARDSFLRGRADQLTKECERVEESIRRLQANVGVLECGPMWWRNMMVDCGWTRLLVVGCGDV